MAAVADGGGVAELRDQAQIPAQGPEALVGPVQIQQILLGGAIVDDPQLLFGEVLPELQRLNHGVKKLPGLLVEAVAEVAGDLHGDKAGNGPGQNLLQRLHLSPAVFVKAGQTAAAGNALLLQGGDAALPPLKLGPALLRALAPQAGMHLGHGFHVEAELILLQLHVDESALLEGKVEARGLVLPVPDRKPQQGLHGALLGEKHVPELQLQAGKLLFREQLPGEQIGDGGVGNLAFQAAVVNLILFCHGLIFLSLMGCAGQAGTIKGRRGRRASRPSRLPWG